MANQFRLVERSYHKSGHNDTWKTVIRDLYMLLMDKYVVNALRLKVVIPSRECWVSGFT